MSDILKLPVGWLNIPMQEAILNVNGARKPVSLKLRAEIQGYYPYYGATGQIDSLNDFTHEGEHVLIGEDGANLLSKTKNLAFIVEGQFWVNNHAHAVKCLADMPSKFVAGYVNSLDLTPYVTGSAQPKLTKGNLEKIPFPLPPLAEQKVIAKKLDKLLSKVDSIKARLDAVPDTLKRFRQSVLAAAVSGKLTEEWRGNKDWGVQSDALSSFVKIDVGHAFKSKEFSEEGVPLLRGQNIEPGALKWNETKYFPEAKLVEHSKLFINEGDIILAMDRPIISTGLKLAIAKKEDLPCVLVQRVARFKEFNGLTPTYLYMLLSELSFMNYIQPNQTGSDIPHISGKQILNFKVNVPSIKEQEELTLRVELLFAYADKVEVEVNATQERVNKLTQSILAKAFRGELTAKWREQNPELISGENSAEALLEKIKAEREKLKPTKKRKAK